MKGVQIVHLGQQWKGKPAGERLANRDVQAKWEGQECRWFWEGRWESWKWSVVAGRGRVSQLSLFTFAHRPNISVTLATLLTWRTSVSRMMTSMWSALEEMTAGRTLTDLARTLQAWLVLGLPVPTLGVLGVSSASPRITGRGCHPNEDKNFSSMVFSLWWLPTQNSNPSGAIWGLVRRGGHRCYSKRCCVEGNEWGLVGVRGPRWLLWGQSTASLRMIRRSFNS